MNHMPIMTLKQQRLAYKRAVLAVLEEIFEKDREEAVNIVQAWWQKLEKSRSYSTGLFMHDEPMNTAADLAKVRRTPAISEFKSRYDKILSNALPKTRKSRVEGQRIQHVHSAAA